MANNNSIQFYYKKNEGEIELTKCTDTSKSRKILIPANVEETPLLTVDGRIFENFSNNKKDLIMEEGIKNIKNFKILLSKEWKKIVYPESLEFVDIDKNELLLKYGTIHIAPKGSYAEKCLKQLKIDGRYNLIVENEDYSPSDERIKVIREFNYREPYEFELDQDEDIGLGAEYSKSADKKNDILTIPSIVNGNPLRCFFYDKIPDNIKKIIIPETIEKIVGLNNHYYTAEGLDQVVISPNNMTYWTDGSAIFSKDKKTLIRFVSRSVKEYSVPDGTETIAKYAFAQLNSIKSISIPGSVNTIEDYAFFLCESLTMIQGLENVETVEKSAIQGCSLLENPECGGSDDETDTDIDMEITGNILVNCREIRRKVIKVPEGITEIRKDAFDIDYDLVNEDLLEEVILPDSLRIIEERAFSRRHQLKKINIPKDVERIEYAAFGGCESLETIKIPPKVKEIELCELGRFSSLFIPETLETIVIKKQVGVYSHSNFIDYIEVDPNNPNYKSVDGILYSKDGKKVIYVPTSLNIKTFEVPEGVEEIASYSCRANKYIEKIIIPKTVKLIGNEAIEGTDSLTEIVFADDSQLKEIGYSAFEFSNISELTLPDGVETIGEGAFTYSNIEKIVIPKSVRHVEFSACGEMPEIEIYDSIDPDAQEAYSAIDIESGKPNSTVGLIGTEYWDGSDVEEQNYSITVRSAKTEEIKYKVWMGVQKNDKKYFNLLVSSWGKNATFAFKELDKYFSKIKGKKNKLKVAEYRLLYPVELGSESQQKYIEYLEKYHENSKEILDNIRIIENDD